ncbi:MAG: sigma-70 family RNA polymerase sigma factor [Clostridiales bacterium]|nr:sigma-70 family RNA polymerase sigma factor [Clostridiales bacterium]
MSNLFRDEVQAELFERAREGDREALDEFIRCNEGLVTKVVNEFKCRWLEDSDLIQEGLIGLLHAVWDFDTSRGIKFSTFAWPVIRQHIAKAVQANDSTIKIPREVRNNYSVICKKVQAANDRYGRDLTDAELIGLGVLSSDEIQLKGEYECLVNIESIDAPVSNADGNNDISLVEMIASDALSADSEAAIKLRDEDLIKALGTLPKEQRQLLLERYGLFGADVHKLKEISAAQGVSKQCINQREKKALKSLSESDKLKGYRDK